MLASRPRNPILRARLRRTGDSFDYFCRLTRQTESVAELVTFRLPKAIRGNGKRESDFLCGKDTTFPFYATRYDTKPFPI